MGTRIGLVVFFFQIWYLASDMMALVDCMWEYGEHGVSSRRSNIVVFVGYEVS